MLLHEKIAVVTGAARGIGQTVAAAYAREGAYLSLWDIDKDTLEKSAGEIRESGRKVLTFHADVTRQDQIAAAVAATLDRFGRIDVLFTCAAVKMSYIVARDRRSSYHFWEIDPERWRLLLDINLTGVFLCCRAVAREMARQGSGSIINMTTGNETKLRRGYSPYGSSKAAVEAFTISIAKELQPLGVRANLLQPGGAVNLRGESDPSLLPHDVMVPAALYLASDKSREVSGELIVGKNWKGE